MRACEGCRRRKIKCDGATSNTWPCSACVRLKLNCTPPKFAYDDSFTDAQPELSPAFLTFGSSNTKESKELPTSPEFGLTIADFPSQEDFLSMNMTDRSHYSSTTGSYQQPIYASQSQSPSFHPPTSFPAVNESSFPSANPFPSPPPQQLPQSTASERKNVPLMRRKFVSRRYSAGDVSDALGHLKITDGGVGKLLLSQELLNPYFDGTDGSFSSLHKEANIDG
jgi:Fungal Zn(2)-Cys(6) binuclear cluster domain